MKETYRFAELNISVESLYEEVHRLCADYRVRDDSDFKVCTIQADIEYEREKTAREDALEGLSVRKFRDGYLETLAVYRKIAEILPTYDAILIHGSCVAVDDEGYLFVAKSGIGKSTHTKLWRELLGERAVMINDDKPLIRIDDNGVRIYGTPWDGKHRLSTNASVSLKAICILERSCDNSICSISAKDAYPMLLQQVYRPMDGNAMSKTLFLIDRLAVSVSLWRLKCNMDIEAARIAYDTMKG